MSSYYRLIPLERSVFIGGRGFSLRPLHFPRKGHAYRIRTLTVRGFLDLWTGIQAMYPDMNPSGALAAFRRDFQFILTASPRMITVERIITRDLMDMTPEQALQALEAFEQINDLEFLFGQFSAPEPEAPKGRRRRQPSQAETGNRVGVVQVIAAFMRAFPAYDLPGVMEMPAPAFFALLEASSGSPEGDGKWKPLSAEEKQALQDRILKRAQERQNV